MGFINKEAFFPTAMVLFGALAPPRQILLHCWGWGLVPLPRKAENNAHFRSSGDMKLGECCTKLGGDTNLSWGLPASTKIMAAPRHKTLRSFCGTRGGFTTRPGFCLEFMSLQLLVLQWISCFFWGKEKSNQCTKIDRVYLAFVVNLPLLKCNTEQIETNLEKLKLQSEPLCIKEVGIPGFLLSLIISLSPHVLGNSLLQWRRPGQ